MTMNKRFINDIDNEKLIDTKGELSTIHYSDSVDFYELWEFLNKLNDENEQLKKDFDSVSHNWALLYDEAKNKVEELSKENKKLKSINNQLEDRLEESGIGIALKMEHFND